MYQYDMFRLTLQTLFRSRKLNHEAAVIHRLSKRKLL